MAMLTWWGSPTRIAPTVSLQKLDHLFNGSTIFADAEPLTVRLRGVMILEDED